MIGWRVPLALVGARWAAKRLGHGHDPEPPPRPAGGDLLGVLPWAAAGVAAGVGAAALSRRRRTGRLTGRVALVVGGSRGLGLQLAREFAAGGASVVVCGRDTDSLDRAVAELTGRGAAAHGVSCDVADPDQVRAMVAEAAARFGRLDFVVNNAGIMRIGPQEALAEEHFRAAMDVMFWAPFHVGRAALDHLRATSGTLVNIISIGGEVAVPHLLPYSCAKAAARALSEGLSAETAGTGVHVTTVVPGLMRTGSHRGVAFTGAPEREYVWFAFLAGLPLLSVGVERAARHIVRAAARGRGHLLITPMARVGTAVHGIAPGLTQAGLGVVGRLLPAAPEQVEERDGVEASRSPAGRLVDAIGTLNERAGDRLNQEPRARRG